MNWTERRKRKARRRLAPRAVGPLSVGLGLVSLVGLGFGVEQTVSTQALLERPPETVWRGLMDLDGMPLWRSDSTTLAPLRALAGRPSWRETGPGGTRVLELVEADPPSRLVL